MFALHRRLLERAPPNHSYVDITTIAARRSSLHFSFAGFHGYRIMSLLVVTKNKEAAVASSRDGGKE